MQPGNEGACSPPRGRNAAATRQAILDSARWCFSHEGYDQVGVRDIAAPAEPILRSLIGTSDPRRALCRSGQRQVRSERAIRRRSRDARRTSGALRLAEEDDPNGFDPLVALLRSSSSEVAGGMLRDALVDGFVRPLAARLDGPTRCLAPSLWVDSVGLLVYRTIVGGAMLQSDERLIPSVTRTLQTLIDGSA